MAGRILAWVAVFAGVVQALAAGPGAVGDWALELPGGEFGWLSVKRGESGLEAQLMWGVGSERPVKDFKATAEGFTFTRTARRPLAPKTEPAVTSRITGVVDGDALKLKLEEDGAAPIPFSGKRMPPVPAKPDLSVVRFGKAVELFNGKDLSGWRVSDPAKQNGWSVVDGVLHNATPKKDFSAYGDHANLKTEAVFGDFKLHIEYRLPPEGGNSGVYLRGMYEAQVTHRDSSMQGINGPGALFGRITPSHNAGRAGGEWNTYELTLVDRHVTIVLNGGKVIDNQPVAGPTGGACQSDVTQPGPILLQGDHTAVEYRNIVLYPVVARK